VFWPRLAWEILHKHAVLADMIVRLVLVKMAIARDPAALSYMDEALSPVRDDEDETLDLLTKTTGGRAAVAHARNIAALTASRTAN
jgi:hypothetical protein